MSVILVEVGGSALFDGWEMGELREAVYLISLEVGGFIFVK